MRGTQHDHPGHGGTLSPTELCAPRKAGASFSAGPETQLSSHGEGHRELWGPLTSTPQKCAALFGTGVWELQGGGGWGGSSWNRFVGADTPPALPHPQLTPCQPFLIFRQTPVRGGCGRLLNGVWGGSPSPLHLRKHPFPAPPCIGVLLNRVRLRGHGAVESLPAVLWGHRARVLHETPWGWRLRDPKPRAVQGRGGAGRGRSLLSHPPRL